MNYLKIKLQAPLMHFSRPGYASFKNDTIFKTTLCPTYNTIYGMIGAAFGYSRGDIRNDELRIKYPIMKYKTVGRISIMVDDQVVHAGEYRNFKKLSDSLKVIRDESLIYEYDRTAGAIQKKVEYLQDAEFNVFIGGTEEELIELHQKLMNPYWLVGIGKFCCEPTAPIVTTSVNMYDEQDEEVQDATDCL